MQVEGEPEEAELEPLRQGIKLKDGFTRPAKVARISAPEVWQRNPPIRYRAEKPTSWIAMTITEGRNRQVRRMTAAIGFPTLRLIRYRVGAWSIDGIPNGEYRAFPLCFPETTGA